jgi:hypothetical protein
MKIYTHGLYQGAYRTKPGGLEDSSSSKSCIRLFGTTFHYDRDYQLFLHFIDLSIILVCFGSI